MSTRQLIGAAGLRGVSALAYGVWLRAQCVTLRRLEVPVLARVRHLFGFCTCRTCTCSSGSSAKQEWLRDLGRLAARPVVPRETCLLGARGHPCCAPWTAAGRPGIFVPGNNDYFEPTRKNPARYIFGSAPDPTGAAYRLAGVR